MHYHIEIVMPPTDDVRASVAAIMAPFDENASDEDASSHRFWDFFVVGGRFAGAKVEARIGRERLDAFHAELTARKVTVSGLTCGKQTLSPATQVPMVDALWREHFPDSGLAVCPLFSHSNDQYDSGDTLPDDVCRLKDVPPDLKAARVLIAGPKWDGDGVQAHYMAQEDFWNGLNHVRGAWDGTVASALADYGAKLEYMKPEWREKASPREDWLVVTVDCHS